MRHKHFYDRWFATALEIIFSVNVMHVWKLFRKVRLGVFYQRNLYSVTRTPDPITDCFPIQDLCVLLRDVMRQGLLCLEES